MANRFSIETVFKAIDRITAPVSRMQNRVGKFTRGAVRGFRKLNRAANKMWSGMKKGARVAAVGLAIFSAALVNVTNVGADFGRAIGSAAAKFPEEIRRGTEEFKALQDAARDVGRTTEFTSVEAARGLNFLAKAGFEAQFSMRALAPIVDFATTSETDFATAADIASDALGAFGLNSQDQVKRMKGLNRVMDVMGKTANSANVTVSELFESVKKSAPVSVQAGVSMETYAATMGVLAKNGIKASDAGTAAKNMTLSLVGVGFKAAKTFKKLSISLTDSKGQLRDQVDVLDDLRGSLSKMTKQKSLGVIEAIFGKRSLASASILLAKDAGKEVRKLRSELEGSSGFNKGTAAFIRDDVKGSLDSLNSAIESVKISIFTMNEGPMKEVIDGMTVWVRANEKLIATKVDIFVKKLAKGISFVVKHRKGVITIVKVVLGLVVALKVLTAVLTLVNLAMAANPVVLITLGVIALIVVLAILAKKFEIVRVGLASIGVWVTRLLGPLGWFIRIATFIIKKWEPISGFFKNLWGGIANIFDSNLDRIKKALSIMTKLPIPPVLRLMAALAGGAINLFQGKGDSNSEGGPPMRPPEITSPQERISRSIEESRTTSSAEVTIKDETGRAEVTSGSLLKGLKLVPTGAF